MSNFYFAAEELQGKYPDVTANFDANKLGSYWIPGACAWADAVCGARYTVPFSPAPQVVKDLAMDMCYYRMTYRNTNQKILKDMIDEAIAGIQNGTLTLVGSGGVVLTAQSQALMSNSGFQSSFGMDDPRFWRVDSSWQQQNRSDQGWPL